MFGSRKSPGPDQDGSAPAPYPGQGDLYAASLRRRRPVRRSPRWLKVLTAVVSVLLLAAVAFGGYWAWRLQSNISTSELTAGGERTEGAVNDSSDRLQILVLGSDTREGSNSQYGSVEDSSSYGQSDVMMLLDISADNKHVNVVSFPRDLLVDVPACTDPKTKQAYPARQDVMINSAMAQAGIGCAVDTVNKLTGLEVDHFMMADFNAVKELSNAVGGVEVCVSDAVHDPDSGLNLPAGTSQVQGEQALAFLRTRHAFANGGDLGRIQAQQGFLASLSRKLKSEGTLGNPQKTLTIADTITRNLTVDSGLSSIPSLLTIANRLKTIDPANINFITAPTTPAPQDPNRLALEEPAASTFFSALRNSPDLSQPAPAAPTETPATPAAPSYDKSLQPVSIANGTGVTGRSNAISGLLSDAGFTNVTKLQAQDQDKTMVYYSAGFEDVAADVAALFGLPAGSVQQVANIQGVQLYAGTDFATGTKPAAPPSSVDSLGGVVAQTGSDQTCQSANPLG
ncbi:LCP family protein [Pseudarthrobacter sp. BRE9]|uniref:LCP family protein n=1 Tax=Pseudarthrobacter sp. BRE9 TaxID=2962582 RepID=UPI0028814FB6|nr:LCP family protein [Pseudarthrobacter sp. BRE9]MDT0168064.1 LCP family protein [Pseudarthrobacter sp. BRE9]